MLRNKNISYTIIIISAKKNKKLTLDGDATKAAFQNIFGSIFSSEFFFLICFCLFLTERLKEFHFLGL